MKHFRLNQTGRDFVKKSLEERNLNWDLYATFSDIENGDFNEDLNTNGSYTYEISKTVTGHVDFINIDLEHVSEVEVL